MATLHEEISGVLISYIGALDKFVDATNKVAKLVEAYSASTNSASVEIAAQMICVAEDAPRDLPHWAVEMLSSWARQLRTLP